MDARKPAAADGKGHAIVPDLLLCYDLESLAKLPHVEHGHTPVATSVEAVAPVSPVKWSAILLMALITLIAIAMVHSDNHLTCGIALALFATGIAASVLLIATYTRPFTGDISVTPDLLQQVITTEPAIGASAQ